MFTDFNLNEKNVFETIARFTNCQSLLDESIKEKFALKVRAFFKEKAYFDIDLPVPEDFKERFSCIDLGVLLDAFKATKTEKCRTVASIEKVTGMHFTAIKVSYQVETFMKGSLWGWAPIEQVRGAGLAQKGLSVSSYHAFDQIAPYLSGDAKEGNSKIYSCESSLVALQEFAKKWGMKSLESCIETLLKQWKPFCDLESLNTHSIWFDAKTPFESIKRFADRFSLLDQEEQKELFVTISDFFALKVLVGESVEIPEKLAVGFARNDLNFLADHLPIDLERHRLIATIQHVTSLQFLALEKGDLIHQAHFKYGSEKMPMPASVHWIRKEFMTRSKEIDQDYRKSEPLKIAISIYQVSSLFQKFQYTRPSGIAINKEQVDAALELLCLSIQLSMDPLRDAIMDWIKLCSESKEMLDHLMRFLDRKEVYSALKLIKNLDILIPKRGLEDDNIYYNVLLFNREYFWRKPFEDIVYSSLGQTRVNNKVLARYKKEQGRSSDLDTYLFDYVYKPMIKQACGDYAGQFLSDAIQMIQGGPLSASPDLIKKAIHELFKKIAPSDDEAKKMLIFLNAKETQQLFEMMGDLNILKLLVGELDAKNEYKNFIDNLSRSILTAKVSPSGVGIILPEDFSNSIASVIEPLEPLNKEEKALKFLKTFFIAMEDNRLIDYILAPSYCNDNAVLKYLSSRDHTIPMSQANALITLLTHEDVVKYLDSLDVQINKSVINTLDLAIRNASIQYIEIRLQNALINQVKDPLVDMQKLKEVISVYNESAGNPSVDAATHQKLLFEELLKQSLLISTHHIIDFRNVIPSKEEIGRDLTIHYIIRSIIDRYFPEEKIDIGIPFRGYMKSSFLSPHEKNYYERFNPYVHPLELVKKLLKCIQHKEVSDLFVGQFALSRNFVEKKIQEYIDNEMGIKKEEPKQESSWFSSFFQ